jgi:hypothetical protein
MSLKSPTLPYGFHELREKVHLQQRIVLRVVLSHPGHKNKSVPRMGHPEFHSSWVG